jgi:hypothetical protein
MSLLVVATLDLALAHEAAGQGDGTKVDVRGTITQVTLAQNGKVLLGTVRIEGPRDKTSSNDKAIVKITAKTKIEKLAGKARVAARFEDLGKGARVQAMFTGPVLESYPVQATAREVLILEAAK